MITIHYSTILFTLLAVWLISGLYLFIDAIYSLNDYEKTLKEAIEKSKSEQDTRQQAIYYLKSSDLIETYPSLHQMLVSKKENKKIIFYLKLLTNCLLLGPTQFFI